MTDTKISALTRWLWTEADFDDMGRHDVRVHAGAANPETHELLFDIDYIIQWEPSIPSATSFTFWKEISSPAGRKMSDLFHEIVARRATIS